MSNSTCSCGTLVTQESGMGWGVCPSCGKTVRTAKIDSDRLSKSIQEKKIATDGNKVIQK